MGKTKTSSVNAKKKKSESTKKPQRSKGIADNSVSSISIKKRKTSATQSDVSTKKKAKTSVSPAAKTTKNKIISNNSTKKRKNSTMQSEVPTKKQKKTSLSPTTETVKKKKIVSSPGTSLTGSQIENSRSRCATEKTLTIPTKQYSKWQVVKQTTRQSVMELIDSNISEVLSVCSSRSCKEISLHLNRFRSRFTHKLSGLKAPVPSTNYTCLQNAINKLEKENEDLDKRIARNDDEIDRLNDVIEELAMENIKLKKQLNVGQAKLTQQQHSGEMNHNQLNLPSINAITKPAALSYNSDEQSIHTDGQDCEEALKKLIKEAAPT